ncbi:MAG: glycosyltransferase [Thermoleophilia bacterium]
MVSTLGARPGELTRLLDSIKDDRPDGVELIVVDQSRRGDAHRLVRTHPLSSDLPPVCITSGRGISTGKNAGLGVATGVLITFPDDDAWYPPGGLTAILKRMETNRGLDALTGITRGSDGRVSLGGHIRRAGPLRRHSVFRQGVEATMVARTDALREIDGFSVEVGVGAPTPWGAAEGPDLLLRMLAGGANIRFDPSLFVYHESSNLAEDAMVSRARNYSRGAGYVVAKNRVLSLHLYRFVVRPAVGVATARVLGQRDQARRRTAKLGGHLRGMIDGFRARNG